mgnify:CR=1 FL=1|tara:strand:+ start:360 stop:995 length:636 start_codon:yes stop_codon:yes gene_type:complete
MEKSVQIDQFCIKTRVSRETIYSLVKYEKLLVKANKNLNLIGKSTINHIWIRHFLDSFQVIDFIDKNDRSIVDIGSGAGFPGLVLAIAAKDRNILMKINLIEKSPKKAKFLEETIKELKLNVTVINHDVFKQKNKFKDDVFVVRAFKPLEIILELIHNKIENLKKFFIFLGKTGNAQLIQASKNWDIKYKQRISVTDNDSLILEVNKLKKK